MADWWDQFKRLFKKAETSSPSNPLLHELIQRTPAERADLERWQETLVCRRLLDWLVDQYAVCQVDPQRIDESIDFLNTNSSKGFVIHFYKTNYSHRDVQHFFDYLKQRMLDIGYRTQISDTRTYNRPKWIETVQRHYVKPRPNFNPEEKQHQRYGNVTIEFTQRDEAVHNLKFRATFYQDSLFHPADDFAELIQEIVIR